MMTATPLTLDVLANRLHERLNYSTGENIVTSPLGMWVLLAQAAGPAAADLDAQAKTTLETWLGMDLNTAYDLLGELLRTTPDAVKLAAAAWLDEHTAAQPKVAAWLEALHPEITHAGNIPAKQVIDAWAKTNTLDIIDAFPIDEQELKLAKAIIANALATKVAWYSPFESVTNHLDHWQSRELLFAKNRGQQTVSLTADANGEVYAVVRNASDDGISVYAVIANNPQTPARDVIRFAEWYAANPMSTHHTPLTNLPDRGDIYTISTITDTHDRYEAHLPAWAAESTHDLVDLGLPIEQALNPIIQSDDTVKGVQVAKAEYNKNGFEAAAVTAGAVLRSAAPLPGERRLVHVDYAHPYAVVATYNPFKRADRGTVWENLPLFTAWVHNAIEVSDKQFG